MRDAFSNVLGQQDEDRGVDRILAAAFFRKQPLALRGPSARVVLLADRQASVLSSSRDFLGGERR